MKRVRLSTAIRKGAQKRGKCTGKYVTTGTDGMLYTCALGAAFEGITGRPPNQEAGDVGKIVRTLSEAIGYDLYDKQVINKVAHRRESVFYFVTAHNDGGDGMDRQYTREEIADLLAKKGL